MQNYPSRTDILTAMQNPKVCFKSDEIIGGAVIKVGGRPIQYSGGYTSVFPFDKKTGERVAVRLWIADIDEAKKRSIAIANYLSNLNSSYFVDFNYIDDAILINGSLYPIVLMEWVDGERLKDYINTNISNLSVILKLAENFKQMVVSFHQEKIAHGDLQHGNILVKPDGTLVVVDYDSMFIEPLNGMKDTIKGLPGYQHPARQNNNELHHKLDYFSELVIYLSLLVFADNPNLWGNYFESEDLLFSKVDFENPKNSKLINNCLNSSNTTISDLTRKMLEELTVTDIYKLRPLEELLVNERESSKQSIIEKWGKQPAPVKPQVQLPDKKAITEKWNKPPKSNKQETVFPNIDDITKKF